MRVAVRPFHYQVGPRHMRRGMYGLGLEPCVPGDSACVARNTAEESVDDIKLMAAYQEQRYSQCVSDAVLNGATQDAARSKCGAQYPAIVVPTKEQILAGTYQPTVVTTAPPVTGGLTFATVDAWPDKQAYDYLQSAGAYGYGDAAKAGVIPGIWSILRQKADRYITGQTGTAPSTTTTAPATTAQHAAPSKPAEQAKPPGNVDTSPPPAATVVPDTIFGVSTTTLAYVAAVGVGVWLMMRGRKG
jgi:hypothetical protein